MRNQFAFFKALTFIFFIAFVFDVQAQTTSSNLKWTKKVGAKKSPNKKKKFNVKDYGAISDGKIMNTAAIQKAIDACAASGGGIVVFDAGEYLTGSVFIKAGVDFRIDEGVTLLGSQDIKDYQEIDTRVAGIEMKWPAALLNILNQEKASISGNGLINAQGKVFWDYY